MARERNERKIRTAAIIALASTVVVVAVKLVAARLSGSVSVLGEGLQSTLDVAMSILALWSVTFASAPPDEDHPYGHGKIEYLAAALQMVLVLFASGIIVWQAVLRFGNPQAIRADLGVAAMGFSVIVNLLVIFYLKSVLNSERSPMLRSEVEHLRVDTLSSLGVLIGLVVVWATGWQVLDPVIALLFVAVGGWIALRQLRRTVHPLLDGALPPDDIEKLEETLNLHPEVRGYHNVRTRDAGRTRLVLLHVLLDDELSFVRAHEIAEEIEDELSTALDGAWVTLHYEPHHAELEHRAAHHS